MAKDIFEELAFCQENLMKNEKDYVMWHRAAELMVLLGATHDAHVCYEKSYILNKKYFIKKLNEVLDLFRIGEYQQAANFFECRAAVLGAHVKALRHLPYWQGEKMLGKKLLVYTEQGRGDSIQFIRYLPLLKKLTQAEIILLVQEDLECLLDLLHYGIDKYFLYPDLATCNTGYKIDLPICDAVVSIMSLIRFLPITNKDALVKAPYVFPEENKVKFWQSFLSQKNIQKASKKVGLVWRGNEGYMQDHLRSMNLAEFKNLFSLKNIAWYSLQKGNAAKEVENFSNTIIDLSNEIKTYADTAAIIKNLDLVITVDTSVLHLSGAIGCPTWALLHKNPDWRWLNGYDFSQWYDSLELFRQTKEFSWEEPVKKIKERLEKC